MGAFVVIFVLTAAALPLKAVEHYESLRTCSVLESEHVYGEWMEMNEQEANAAANAPCCSSREDSSLRNNQTICGSVTDFNRAHTGLLGRHLTRFSGRPDHLAFMADYACSCRNHFRNQHKWIPYTCSLPNWNAVAFCQLLGERKILFLGDSLMAQTAAVFMNNAHSGGCQTQIIYGSTDTLVDRDLGVLNRGMRWSQHVREVNPDIVIVNAGAHVRRLYTFRAMLVELLDEHDEFFPDLPLLWRSQYPGGCSPSLLRELPGEAYWMTHRSEYNHRKFLEWDSIAKSTIRSHKNPNVHFLDMTPLHYRFDAHVRNYSNVPGRMDCLHFCVPGVLDEYFPRVLHKAVAEL